MAEKATAVGRHNRHTRKVVAAAFVAICNNHLIFESNTNPNKLSYLANITSTPASMFDPINRYYHIYDMKLGEGGFAKVRLASHIVTKQLVAIKCLDKVKLQAELPRIYNEIECLKALKHQHIARLLQVFENETNMYFVLEHCPGGELFDYIVKKKRLEEPESAQIIYDLMKVLEYIHSNGFAHRDLKPENILFNDRHQIKLIDFGLAANCTHENMSKNKDQPPINQLRTCCGSVTYAAPELISGEVYCGKAVDVWSSGVMLYAMLVGQVPFNDQSISKLYMKIKRGISTMPSYLSTEAQDLIHRMLKTNPNERIKVSEILAHPWLRCRVNPSSKIARRPLDGLDENLFVQVCHLFPQIKMEELRQYIAEDFNYISATYWLLSTKSAPRTTPVISRPRPMPLASLCDKPLAQGTTKNTIWSVNSNKPSPLSETHKQNMKLFAPVKPRVTDRTRFATVRKSPFNPRASPSVLIRKKSICQKSKEKEKEKNKISIVKRLLRF